MKIRHMKYFVALAEELHFGKAASRLNISQPPLSQQIKQLETNIGVILFKRTKHKVELTNAGKVLLDEAYIILEQIDKAIKKTVKTEKGESGELILGFSSHSMFDVLPIILSDFYHKYPLVNVKVKQVSTSEQIQALNKGEIQAGLLCPPINDTSLCLKNIYEQKLILALPIDHPLNTNSNSIDIDCLNQYPFIMTPRNIGPGYYDNVISICFDVGFSPNIIQEANDLHTCISLVSTGMGIALVPASLKQYRKEGVVYKDINTHKTIKTTIAWHQNNSSKVLENFLKIANDIFKFDF